jgi:serine/threonine protein kinase
VEGVLPLALCRRILADVLRALAAAHAAGVVHRDLKPANVLLRRTTGEPVVVDFGVAVDAVDGGTAGRAGTRGYIAPEHLAGAPPDARSDLYAVGVLTHRLATGVLPGEGAVRPLPPALAPLAEACLRSDPRERPRDAHAALSLLEPGRRRPGRAMPWRLVAAALGMAATLAVVRPWRTTRAAPAMNPTLAVVDTTALAPSEAWLGEAFRRLVVEDAMDAWAIEVRAPPAAAVPSGAVRSRLWRDAAGGLRATVAGPQGAPRDLAAPSLRALASEAARTLAVALAPAVERHPTAQELREVGAHDPEAWRQFRRARRAARMEHWDACGRWPATRSRAIPNSRSPGWSRTSPTTARTRPGRRCSTRWSSSETARRASRRSRASRSSSAVRRASTTRPRSGASCSRSRRSSSTARTCST